MGFELTRTRPLADELKRILCELADDSLALVRARYETEPAAAVHQLRRNLRRMRALLRLVRPIVGKAAWKLENAALRDLGRQLSHARDAVVMGQTLERLLGDDPETAAALQQMLPAPAAVELPALEEVCWVLERVRGRMEAWPLSGKRWGLVGRGLEATYRAGRLAGRRARRRPTGESLHEWRKRAKELRYQLETLAPWRPPALGRRAKQLGQFCDLLGEEHDLSLLRQALVRLPGVRVEHVLMQIDLRRRELKREAKALGRRLYGVGGRGFVGWVRRG